MKLIYKFLILASVYILICGFTFNEDVLTICEQKHPVDFIARVVCNNNVEKKQMQDKCMKKQENFLNEKFYDLNAFLDLNHPTKISELAGKIESQLGYKTELVNNSNNPMRKVIVFGIPQQCESGYSFHTNIHEDTTHNANLMTVWKEDKNSQERKSERVESYEWNSRATKINNIRCFASSEASFKNEACSYSVNIDTHKATQLLTKVATTHLHPTVSTNSNIKSIKSDVNTDYLNFYNELAKEIRIHITFFDIIESDSKDTNSKTINFINPNTKDDFSKYVNNYYLKVSLSKNKDSYDEVTVSHNLSENKKISYLNYIYLPNNSQTNLSKEEVSNNSGEYYLFFTISAAIIILFTLAYREEIINKFNQFNSDKDNKEFSTINDSTIDIKRKYAEHYSTKQADATIESQKSVTVNATDITSLTTNHSTLNFERNEASDEFQSKYPFVMIYVRPDIRNSFINECLWLEKKIGNFPTMSEQESILKSLDETTINK